MRLLEEWGCGRSRNRCGGGGVGERFNYIYQVWLAKTTKIRGGDDGNVVGREREGRGESGREKMSSIMRVVGGLTHLWHAPKYWWRINKVVRY